MNGLTDITIAATPNYTVKKFLMSILSLLFYFGVIDGAIRSDKSQAFFVVRIKMDGV